MAKLTYKQRKSMPASEFAVVEKKKVKDKDTGKTKEKTVKRFPINDKAHARNALARLPQAKGLNSSEKSAIKKKAAKVLGHKTDSMRSMKEKYKG